MRTYEQIAADAEDCSPFSNGSEYDHWADRWCYRCRRDDAETETWCPILSVAMLGSWPKELTRHYVKFGARIEGTSRVEVSETTADDPDGCAFVDRCTEFEERRDDDGDAPEPQPSPPPVIDGQVDMFEVFADQVVEQIGHREAVAA